MKRNQNFAIALYYKGIILQRLKQYSRALEFIGRALELDFSKSRWLIGKATTLMSLGYYEESLKSCYEALKIEPNKYWYEIAVVHEHFKRYEEALECIDKAIINFPDIDFFKRCKAAIIGGLKFGNYYYIPIVKSKLLNLVPFEDIIIYTTRIKIRLVNTNLLTDAIITNNALICVIPHMIDPRNWYIPWEKIRFRSQKSFTFSGFKCQLLWDDCYESKKEFDARSKSFRRIIDQLRKETQIHN